VERGDLRAEVVCDIYTIVGVHVAENDNGALGVEKLDECFSYAAGATCDYSSVLALRSNHCDPVSVFVPVTIATFPFTSPSLVSSICTSVMFIEVSESNVRRQTFSRKLDNG
jgi:hypothetical protein